MEKACGKKHMSPQGQNGDLASFDEGGDGTTSSLHHPKFHYVAESIGRRWNGS
jgi:hypothetical protein